MMLSALLLATLIPGDPSPLAGIVEEARRSWGVPGVAVAVVRGDEVLYLAGHGTRGVGLAQPITPQTLFPISSCTKAFTTTLLARLVDAGKLDWDDPVRKHVPEFHLSDALADREVRLRDLLCHRVGLRGHEPLWYRAPWTRADLIRRVGLLPLDKPFRSTFQYQNTMFVVAGQAAENAGGELWEKAVRDRILTPLGMTSTFTHAENVSDAKLARGHRPGPDGLQSLPLYLIDKPDPAVSMISNAADLAKWLQFHLRGGKPLVSKAAFDAMKTPQIALPLDETDRDLHPDTVQMSYGLGWVLHDYRGHQIASHAGILDGFRVHLTLAPRDGIGIAILANHERTRMHLALSNSILDQVLKLAPRDWNRSMQEVLSRTKPMIVAEPNIGKPNHPLADYAGKYEHPAYGTIEIRVVGDGLRWLWNRFNGPIDSIRQDTFRLREPVLHDPEMTFHLDPKGAIDRLEMHGTFQMIFRRLAN